MAADCCVKGDFVNDASVYFELGFWTRIGRDRMAGAAGNGLVPEDMNNGKYSTGELGHVLFEMERSDNSQAIYNESFHASFSACISVNMSSTVNSSLYERACKSRPRTRRSSLSVLECFKTKDVECLVNPVPVWGVTLL